MNVETSHRCRVKGIRLKELIGGRERMDRSLRTALIQQNVINERRTVWPLGDALGLVWELYIPLQLSTLANGVKLGEKMTSL